MEIKKSQLREAIRKTLHKKLTEGTDFSAKRRIDLMATQTALEFENTIVKELKLMQPDQMQDMVQKKYLSIVHAMKSKIRKAAIEAANQLAALPREQKEV